MGKRNLSKFDASSHAGSELDYIIREKEKESAPKVPTVTVEQAMSEQRVFEVDSNRDSTRILFISQNEELLNPSMQTLDGYINISDLFDEVHILILRHGIPSRNPVLRVASNVWIYTATSRFWWLVPDSGLRMIEDQLVFAEGFRPDLIVARDPFESAYVAQKIARMYNRPTQLHILEDFTDKKFKEKDKMNKWRVLWPRFLIPRFSSVRTSTDKLLSKIENNYKIKDLVSLPLYHEYESLFDFKTNIDLKEKYPSFSFFILYIGNLNHKSTFYRAIDAVRFVLRNPRICMIMIGDGPNKVEALKRAKILGIDKQIIFESSDVDQLSYMKSSNFLVITDTDEDGDNLAIKGAAVGVPMILSKNEKRNDLFKDGESAFIYDGDDTKKLTACMSKMINDSLIKKRFVENSQSMISERFHTDPKKYRESYRMSIEQAFFVGEEDNNNPSLEEGPAD